MPSAEQAQPASRQKQRSASRALKAEKGKHHIKYEVVLQVEELEERIAPSIVLTNPGGNEPQGSGASNGKAIDYENPAGHAPPGWNK